MTLLDTNDENDAYHAMEGFAAALSLSSWPLRVNFQFVCQSRKLFYHNDL